jgi:hypothetical protein
MATRVWLHLLNFGSIDHLKKKKWFSCGELPKTLSAKNLVTQLRNFRVN